MSPRITRVLHREVGVRSRISALLARCGAIILALVTMVCIGLPSDAAADGPLGETVTPGSNLPKTYVEAKVESRPDGVYIQISVRQSVPGSQQSAQQTSNTQSSPSADAGTSSGSAGRWWTDLTGIHYQAPDGSAYDFMPPNIGSATQDFWQSEFAAHPDQTPYTFFADNQYQGIIWIPNTNNSNIVFGPPPPAPGGNGSSTDPYQVALDALGHVPLPNIQIRVNPALGLVAMPGWFWVEGYDGQPFGTSRTVDIPPEVGPDVPFDVVPADDPRRQGTSFTVDVRVWPSQYEWSFGDGSDLISHSLGQKYPLQSDIQHAYEHSSLPFPSGFPVQLTIVFAAEFSINGGAPQGLPPISRTYQAGYRVQEVQPVLVAR